MQAELFQKMQDVLKHYPTEMLILELGDRGKVLHRMDCPCCERTFDIDKPLLLINTEGK